MLTIDLNCDTGESFGNYRLSAEEEIFPLISSANIACGFHAGDWSVMEHTVQLALKHNVAIGAHPGFPDLQGFGRREMKMAPKEIYQVVLYQVGALAAFVKAAGGRLCHVKPHGALYNLAARHTETAQAIVDAVQDFDRSLILYALSGSEMIRQAQHAGLRTASEVFADRSYQADGSLTPRNVPGAMIESPEISLQQALQLVTDQQVKTLDGKVIPVIAETVCLHGDTAHASGFARNLVEGFAKNGIHVQAPAL
jgi:5-oxoprolinase (ATP-hydrolysing) subunit A